MNSKFSFFTGDVNYLSYGGVWARKVGDMRYHFIRLENMDECCGSDNEGRPRYDVALSEVDLGSISADDIRNAVESCGGCVVDSRAQGGHLVLPPNQDELADACRSYGIYSPLHHVATNNARKGIAECRKESYRLTADAEAYEDAMNRPVNRIGSTAREFGSGNWQAALLRGIESGDQDTVLIGKMYHNTGGQTLGGKVDVGPITDALARRQQEG